nr:mechanosensitive ion channel family protein [Thiobacillaceae bacterium]
MSASCKIVLFWGLMLACMVVAAGPSEVHAEAPPAEASATVERAEVRLDAVPLFEVRGTRAYPATQRAEDIADRIRAIADDRGVSVSTLRVAEAEEKSTILVGERPLMSVLDADARMEDVRRHILAELYRKRIAEAIATYRADRSPDVLLTHTLFALGATLALAGLIFALRRGYRWLEATATRRMAAHLEGVARGTLHLFDASQLWRALHGILKGLQRLITALAIYFYLNFVLELYPWTRPAARAMFDLIMDPLRAMGTALVREIPSLITLLIVFLVTRYVLRLTVLFFSGVERGSIKMAGLDAEVIWPTYRIVRLLVIVFALVVAYPYIPGSETDAFKGISLFMGLVFSLGSTTVIGNIIAGYTMIYRRAFKIGDRIKVGDVAGEVLERHLLVTR